MTVYSKSVMDILPSDLCSHCRKNHAREQESDLNGHSGNLGYWNCVKSWYGDMDTYSELFSSAQFISDVN